LKISNEDLLQFAHVASHDLQEPVRKIKTFTYLLRDDMQSVKPEKWKFYIDKILNSAHRMSTMIDGVLTYSSLNGSRFSPEPVDLTIIVSEIKTDLEILLQQKNGLINYTSLPVVTGSRILLYQLFYNLISNSLKFSDPGRSATIDITWHEDRTKGKSNYVITLKDNGIGFESQYNELIFDNFSRLNSKDRFDGTGLGLSLCRKIVERHGGSIRAEGYPGDGALFIIEIPSVGGKS